MPALRLEIDGNPLACVATSDADFIDVSINANRVGPERATLSVHGGTYPEGQDSTFLIWLEDLALESNQTVTISFVESGETTSRGRTIEELFPDEPEKRVDSPVSIDTLCDELEREPRLFQTLPFKVTLPGKVVQGQTDPSEYAYAFHVSWGSHRPDSIRVSLHSYTIESIRKQQPVTEYRILERLGAGESVTFGIGDVA